jgi:uncharacterized membrane protein YbjE (DUF340 family)
MFGGIAAGYLLRRAEPLRKVGKLISIAIYLLLFLLGITVGSNPKIMDNLAILGWQAFLIAFAGTSGSVLLAGIMYHYFFKERKTE